jgi:DNA-directed RNA polymerase subunit RPC12/RpoP
MADFVTLTCPSCGGKLQITNDLETFACGYCGTEHIIKRGGGVIAIKPIIEGIKGVKIGVDKTASELAIKRLKEEIKVIYDEVQIQKNNLDNSQEDRPGEMVLLALFGIALITALLGFTQTLLFGVVASIFFIIITFVFAKTIAYNNKRMISIKDKYKKHIENLDHQMIEKKTELEKHKEIVRG